MKIIISILTTMVLGMGMLVPVVACAQSDTVEVKLDNPLSSGQKSTDPAFLIGLIIKSILGIVGGLTLAMMVWGGFQWLTSAGSPEKVKKGTQTMLWAVIGLILVLGSYVLVSVVLNFLAGAKS